MLEGKLPTGTSKTKKIQIYLDEVALFWMSQWAAVTWYMLEGKLAATGPLINLTGPNAAEIGKVPAGWYDKAIVIRVHFFSIASVNLVTNSNLNTLVTNDF